MAAAARSDSDPTVRILPHNGWWPRSYQKPLWRYLDGRGKRALAIWHRRAGKDEVALHFAATAMITRPASYWHCLPQYDQARKAIWTSVNAHTGKRRIDEAFPPEIRAGTNDNEMFIRFANGSTWQLVGSDRYDALVGAGVAGITYSEWSLANPAAWAYHRPMLEENNGWAIFISTPRGPNHLKAMWEHAQTAPGWFAQRLTVEDTGALSQVQLNAALAEYQALYGADVGRAQYRQEYLCDFAAAVLGAFYALEMAQVRDEGRILELDALPDQPVHRAWDIGVRDDTSIWWFQPVGAQVRILDCYAASGAGVEHYAEVIERKHRERGWRHGTDYVPHDAKVLEFGSGRTRVETMKSVGLSPMLVPGHTVLDGINAVRRTLPLCLFHPRTEHTGMAALEQYRREWDEDKKAFRLKALHDWTSDYADSFRYLAMSWRPVIRPSVMQRSQRNGGWVIPPPPDVPRRGMLL